MFMGVLGESCGSKCGFWMVGLWFWRTITWWMAKILSSGT
jgi:hypothetical protein